ncbi:MAG: hypothetical protein ACFBSE_25465, partial [Prochloraceae cyanobacterium]
MGEYLNKKEAQSISNDRSYNEPDREEESQFSNLLPKPSLNYSPKIERLTAEEKEFRQLQKEAVNLRTKQARGETLSSDEQETLDYVNNVEAALKSKPKSVEQKAANNPLNPNKQTPGGLLNNSLQKYRQAQENRQLSRLNSPDGQKISNLLDSPQISKEGFKTSSTNSNESNSFSHLAPPSTNSTFKPSSSSPSIAQTPQIAQTEENSELFVAPSNLISKLDANEVVGKTSNGNYIFKTDNAQEIENAAAMGLPVKELNDSEISSIRKQQKDLAINSFANVESSIRAKAGQLTQIGQTIDPELTGAEMAAKQKLNAAAIAKKNLVTNSATNLTAQLAAKAEAAKTQVTQQHQNALTQVTSRITTAKAKLDSSYQASLVELDNLEANISSRFSAPYTDAVVQLTNVSIEYENQAIATGEAKKVEYANDSPPQPSNAILEALESFDRDTYVANWRAAKQNAATQVAEAYQEEIVANRQKQIDQVMAAQENNFDGLRRAISLYRENIVNKYNAASSELESIQQSAISSLNGVLTQQTTAIDFSHQNNLNQLNSTVIAQNNSLDNALIASTTVVTNKSNHLKESLHSLVQKGFSGINEAIATALAVISARTEVNPENIPAIETYLEDLVNDGIGHLSTGIVKAKDQISIAAELTTIDNVSNSALAALDKIASSSQQNLDSLVSTSQTAFSNTEAKISDEINDKLNGASNFFKQQTSKLANGIDRAEKNLIGKLAETQETAAAQHREVLSKQIATTDTEADRAAARVRPAWKQIVGIIVTVVIAVATTVAIIAFAASGGWLVGLGIAALIGAAGGVARTAANDLIDGTISSADEYLQAGLIGAGEGILQLVGFKGATQLAGQASSQFTKWAIGTGVEGGADFTTDIGTRFATGED